MKRPPSPLTMLFSRHTRRRELIARVGAAGAYGAVPHLARAQQGTRMRRFGMLMGYSEANPTYRAYRDAFILGLTRSGWREGESVQIEQRWTGDNIDLTRRFAKEQLYFNPMCSLPARRRL
jgi:hypothetical protein